ncbi:MAG: 50S ribosomal protein L29 [Candidatus Yanofskybacteria bacterium RIFCSPLOWO2_01_FULL_49_25]|uniref:Large ribosomal subunit protein uL29 n=1 Tax=Candidatus Yanofskybacteria bacterium RIFCSPLOWO2_01_FULL_49_25 TaxID=1802701 RepID=A0A1F8GUR1_9BACT|nr:MAG: 50S ribosomal protein L29 [Candidatus Yanofskybacteria bacterium RIFCSPLOWO2_01_FULL_49_25]
MKYTDIQDKEVSELQEMLKDARLKLGKLNFELKSKTLKNVSQVGATKRFIAQIMTALNVKSDQPPTVK